MRDVKEEGGVLEYFTNNDRENETSEEVILPKLKKTKTTESTDMKLEELQDLNIKVDDTTLKELLEEIEKHLERFLDSSGYNCWKCKLCGKSNRKRTKVSEHIETHLENFTFDCEFCNKTSKTRKGLRAHMIYNHTKRNNMAASQDARAVLEWNNSECELK